MGLEFEVREDNTGEIIEASREAITRALEAIGFQCEAHAKTELQNTPTRIDTGRLRNSISHYVEGDSTYVGTNVEYAIYVHEGTRKMAPNAFLRNAVMKNRDEYKAIAESYLKNG